MDPSARFFGKLRNLAVNLETETASLQQTHQNNIDEEDPNIEGGVRVLHELNSEVRALKGQVKKQLLVQQAVEKDVRSFITNCMVLKQRTTEDIQRLRRHFEKYGYNAPTNTQKHPESNGQDSDASAKEDEAELKEGMVEVEGHQPSVTPPKMPYVDPMRTPQLSDFGLSEIHLKRCTLHLDDGDDDLHTPRIVDFGLSEHSMCLNNDFTMDLQRKKDGKPLGGTLSSGSGVLSHRPTPVLSTPPSKSTTHHLASMESPEAPVFSTPGLKIIKLPQPSASSPPPLNGGSDPKSPCRFGNHQDTPEVPAFETLYINRLLSTRKGDRDTQADVGYNHMDLPAPNRGSSQARSYIPEISIIGCAEDKPMPEMPSLESFLGNSLSSHRGGAGHGAGEAGVEQRMCAGEIPVLEQDGPTQTFNLGTPRVRRHCTEPSTPEMPDLSAVTQGIFKLISQSKKLPTAVIQPHLKPSNIHAVTGKKNRAQRLALVSEMEFLSLPRYLRQIPLSSLNQAVEKINRATEEQGHDAGFPEEELKRITGVGTKAPIYFLCLTELKRLENVQGVGTSAVYKVAHLI
ncbi:hypothetical protein DPEC_G00049560 [Dallia pectoralis]|uniref:Uncharacterized protein n=1 Tax=Dallia pectoralis TaxID=75939 RepID=A0ACC2HAP3_DALPE|nr:hypothetical protein DPEC_G00049560 [Dallia pectoralis]